MDDMYVSPAEVRRGVLRWTPTTMLVIGVVALMVIATVFIGWSVGWWFTAQNINRQAHITQNSYENQVTLHQQITQDIATVDSITAQMAAPGAPVAALDAQRKAVVNIVCGDAQNISNGYPLTGQELTWVEHACFAGSVNPTSPYFK